MTLPDRAEVVVVGGGVIGVSTAFHLAEAGVRDVLLLDRGPLGGGSTCRAAGGVRSLFSDPVNVALGQRSLEAFASFGTRPGQEVDLQRVGYLFLLDREEDVAAMEAAAALQRAAGVEARLVDPQEARRLSPLVRTDGLLAAAWSPHDGHCTPESVVLGYATAARRLGAVLRPHCAVEGIEVRGGEVTGVRTAQGTVATSTVVLAAGAWSAELAGSAGLDLPVVPLRRQVALLGPVEGMPAQVPMTIDFTTSLYFHREGPGVLMGMSDPDEQPGFSLARTDAWLPRLTAAVERRAPALAGAEVRGGWAGLYEVTPDHNALVGEATGAGRLLYATGFSGHGFLMGPAVGEVVRDLVLGRTPPVDVSGLGVERFAEGVRPERNVV